MPRKPNPFPKIYHHKPTNQDRVVITRNGQRTDINLGPHNSQQSREAYARIVAKIASGEAFAPASNSTDRSPQDITVQELLAAYKAAKCAGMAEKEWHHFRRVFEPLMTLHGTTFVAKFGPLALEEVRNQLIRDDLSGGHINRLIGRIRRVWKWAASREIIPFEQYQKLTLLEDLKSSDKRVRFTKPTRDVPLDVVEKTLPFLSPIVADMVRFQMLTGARPGEVCEIRPCDIVDPLQVGEVEIWVWFVDKHKKADEGRFKFIALRPRAQTILAPYLERDKDDYCFSPREVWEAAGKRFNPNARKKPGKHYTTQSYGHALSKALAKAKRQGVEIPHWHLHQLRHLVATEVQAELGIEAARAILGHKSSDITSIVYAHADLLVAAEAAAKLG